MTNGKKSAQAKKKRRVDLASPRALLRKHARIKKNGRVELKKGWSDKKIAKKAKARRRVGAPAARRPVRPHSR